MKEEYNNYSSSFYSFSLPIFLIVIILVIIVYLSFFRPSAPTPSEQNENLETLENKENKREIEEEIVNEKEIPKIVIQTWKSKTNIPVFLQKSRDSIQVWMPDFEYLFFDDDDIDHFIKTHYSSFYDKFKAFPFTIQRIDFFRYCAVHYYGGIYLDGDVIVDGPMAQLLELCRQTQKSVVFPMEYNLAIYPELCQRFVKDGRRPDEFSCQNAPFGVGQYAFASVPRHPFWMYLIKRIPQYLPLAPGQSPRSFGEIYYTEVYTSTGPDQVSLACHEYFTGEENELLLLTHSTPFRFGDFAQHYMQGTWK
jgi:mannosyltransferase OCH1-like enzyme